MTLGEAIVAAHERGDTAERNRLLALANQHATIRDLCALLGVSLPTAHKWVVRGRGSIPSALSALATPVPSANAGITSLETPQIGPSDAQTSSGRGTQEGTS